jgi:hypothetical protein
MRFCATAVIRTPAPTAHTIARTEKERFMGTRYIIADSASRSIGRMRRRQRFRLIIKNPKSARPRPSRGGTLRKSEFNTHEKEVLNIR